MEKVIICFLLLLCCNSYSQEKEDRIEMFPISENDDIKNSCETLEFHYPLFMLYICSREKNIYTSFVQDTLTVVFELKIQFYFTDTSTYLTIKEINKLTSEVLLSDKTKEKIFINETVFQMMQNSDFYYNDQKGKLNETLTYYVIIPFKFIPQIPPCENKK